MLNQVWSKALGFDVQSLHTTSEDIQHLTQQMVNFMQLANAAKVTNSLNASVNSFLHNDEVKLQINHGSAMSLDDESLAANDHYMVDLANVVKGSWPQSWSDDIRTALLLTTAYTSAVNALNKNDNLDWRKLISCMVTTYVKEHGLSTLREHSNDLDGFVPQIITGAALALTPSVSQMEDFHKSLSTIKDRKPSLDELLGLLHRAVPTHNDSPVSSM